MLLIKVLFILLSLVALASGQRDWKFRRPSRIPPRRPVYHTIRPTTFAPKPEITTEYQPHVTITSSSRPFFIFTSTQSPPKRVSSHHRQPSIVWTTTSTSKPTVAVIDLPSDHSHIPPTTTTAKPQYVYPTKPLSIPDDIPIAHESEPLYSIPKPESDHELEHKISSFSKPTPSPNVEIAQPSTEVSSTEAKTSMKSETTPAIKPASEEMPVITSTFQPSPTLQPTPQPEALVPKTSTTFKPTTSMETSKNPHVSPAPEVSPKPTATSAPEISFGSEASTTEHKSSTFSLWPESKAQSSSEPTVETTVTSHLKPVSESQSKDEVPVNNIKFKYIPGIGKSRNPTSSSWTKPTWFPKPSKKPEHSHHETSTFKPSIHFTSKSLPNTPKSYLKTFSERLSTASPPNHAVDKYMLMDYHCREPYAYFAVPTMCDAYIECKANKARQLNCPDGLHFNHKSIWPEYACSYPSEVKCASHDETQTPKPTADCPRQYGYFQSRSGDCGEYIMCQEGKATEMYCPSGLAFNLATTACDWPANVPSCNPDVFKGFTCPVPEMGRNGKLSDIITNKQRYEKSCKKYIACQRGSPRLLSCDKGLSFDDVSQSCIDDEFVTNCS